jgi:hypothetical protein
VLYFVPLKMFSGLVGQFVPGGDYPNGIILVFLPYHPDDCGKNDSLPAPRGGLDHKRPVLF